MARLRLLGAALLLGALALPGLAEDTIPLAYGGAPPYWTPTPNVAWEMARSGRQPLAATSAPLPLVAIDPCRQYDSRSASALADNTPRTVALIGAPCGIPADAQAVAANITVFSISGAGSNGVFKVGTVAPPTTAWINYPPTETQRANAGVLPLGAGGTITVQVNQGAGSVNFVVDVFGYYSPLGVVNTVNNLSGAVTLTPGSNVTITPSGQSLTVSAAVPSGAIVYGKAGDSTLVGQGFSEFAPMAIEAWSSVSGTGTPPNLYRGAFCAVWTGAKLVVWGGMDVSYWALGTGSVLDPVTNTWTPISTTNAPAARKYHNCVWTGSEMLVWGGEDSSNVAMNSGGRYNPSTDTWAPMSTTGAPAGRMSFAAVWTGSRMVVWGGGERSGGPYTYPTDGGRYNPSSDTWSPMSTASAPTARAGPAAVWTGSKMVVWSGYASNSPFVFFNDGGLYDPVADTWAATTTTNAPAARYGVTGAWTGSRMFVWGGLSGAPGSYVNHNTGGLYDPVADAWTATSTVNAPQARSGPAVWTGSRVIVWGGIAYLNPSGSTTFNSGGLFDPSANAWTSATTLTNAPAAVYAHQMFWTGSPLNEAIIINPNGSGSYYRALSMFVKN